MSKETETLIEFQRHASRASYHYADDSCKEWGLAKQEKDAAIKLFDDNPSMQNEMREMASGELWSLSSERPITNEGQSI